MEANRIKSPNLMQNIQNNESNLKFEEYESASFSKTLKLQKIDSLNPFDVVEESLEYKLLYKVMDLDQPRIFQLIRWRKKRITGSQPQYLKKSGGRIQLKLEYYEKKETSLPIRESLKLKRKSEIGSPSSISNLPHNLIGNYETNLIPPSNEIINGSESIINEIENSISFNHTENYFNPDCTSSPFTLIQKVGKDSKHNIFKGNKRNIEECKSKIVCKFKDLYKIKRPNKTQKFSPKMFSIGTSLNSSLNNSKKSVTRNALSQANEKYFSEKKPSRKKINSSHKYLPKLVSLSSRSNISALNLKYSNKMSSTKKPRLSKLAQTQKIGKLPKNSLGVPSLNFCLSKVNHIAVKFYKDK